MKYHEPVLLQEVIDGLSVKPGNTYIDATVGGGGHTKAIVEAGATVLGIDIDSDAIDEVKTLGLPRTTLAEGNFSDIKKIAKENGFSFVDGILFDLGVSSHQLDDPTRGFSYKDGQTPLLSRLSRTNGLTAEEVVNHESEQTLTTIFETFGEEQHARRIARGIVRSRQIKKITKAGELLTIIKKVVGNENNYRTGSRIFQAIRMFVNDELTALRTGLSQSYDLLKPEGRLVVISFHSLEDRIVKQFLKNNLFHIITKKPIIASQTEQAKNKRSRSAKLRIGEKI